jgi:hypothetical protein
MEKQITFPFIQKQITFPIYGKERNDKSSKNIYSDRIYLFISSNIMMQDTIFIILIHS